MKNLIAKTTGLLCILLMLSGNAWAQGWLYAVDGAGGEQANVDEISSLFQLDLSDGSVIAEIGSIGFPHVTGIAVHPQTGELYGVVSDIFGDTPAGGLLIKIDRTTGQGTLIGAHDGQLPDISFDSNGVLYAWYECCTTSDDLYTLNLDTGAATLVGECGCNTARTGLAFDSADNLYLKNGSALYSLDPSTGLTNSLLSILDSTTQNLMTFGPGDLALTGARISSNSQFELKSVDVDTGTTQSIGINDIGFVSAIEYTDIAPASTRPVPATGPFGLAIMVGFLMLLAWFRQRKVDLSKTMS